ncbi:MAG: Lhr family helicase [Gammaproteobacteria bacterium]
MKGGEDRVDTARSFNWSHLLEQLINAHRATRLQLNSGGKLWVAAERLAELLTVYPEAVLDPLIDPVKEPDNEPLTRDDALRELLRSRLEGLGPVTATELARPLGLAPAEIDTLLLGLEAQGGVMRGRFSNASSTLSPLAGESGSEGKLLIEWCDRRLLARIHRYTLKRLRSEIEPVASADYLRFLLDWHGLNERSEGKAALAAALEQLEGYSAPAAAWEEDILPARISDYAPYYLDQLCAGGLVAWARLAPPRSVSDDERKAGPVRGTPIALVYRENLPHWHALVTASDATHFNLSHAAQTILVALQQHGALFFGDIVDSSGLLRTQAETALGELTAWGLVTADGFAGLRALITPQHRRPPIGSHSRYRMRRGYTPGVDEAGRWSSVPRVTVEQEHVVGAEAILHIARALLGRYGVVFRQVLTRESGLPPWRDLLYSYRRLEARGEIRGGRFVQGFSGEQFALPEAVGALREWRKRPKTGALVSLSAADPLNLVGVILPGERVPMQGDNRVLYRDGVPVAVQVAEEVKFLEQVTAETEWTLRNRLLRKQASQMSGVIQ